MAHQYHVTAPKSWSARPAAFERLHERTTFCLTWKITALVRQTELLLLRPLCKPLCRYELVRCENRLGFFLQN